jgi:hypothetical protein
MKDRDEGAAAERLRNRARLVEFLKFRVLASQESFFASWLPPDQSLPQWADALDSSFDLHGFRAWLTPLWPAAASLSDEDLRHGLEQARRLYLDIPAARS